MRLSAGPDFPPTPWPWSEWLEDFPMRPIWEPSGETSEMVLNPCVISHPTR